MANSAGSKVNIRLGQSPDIKNPQLNSEFQLIFNALHLLSGYLDVLRQNLESADGQTPSESVRFRRTFWGTALQDISVGAVVSVYQNGIINGVAATLPAASVIDPAVTVGSTGSRALFGIVPRQFFIALTAAVAGQPVQVGVGPGVLQMPGAKCGQLIWGVQAISVDTQRTGGDVVQNTTAGTPVNNGGLYLDNILGHVFLVGGQYDWEGYSLPGFPFLSGSTYFYSRAFLFPIGVCVLDNYVLFSDYKRSDSPPSGFHP